MKRIEDLEEAKNKHRNDYYDTLISGKFLSIQAFKNISLSNGIYFDNNHIVVVLNVLEDVIVNKQKINQMFSDIIRFNSKYKFHIINRLDKIIILVDLKEETDISKELRNDLENLITSIVNKHHLNFYIGISAVCDNFTKISSYIKQAEEVLKLAEKNANTINYYDKLMSYHLISNSIEFEEKESIYIFTC